MTALVLGEANKASPTPRMNKFRMMVLIEVVEFSRANSNRDTADRAIPIEDTIRGSILSESQPENGDSRAMVAGCTNKIMPVSLGLSFLIN